MFSLLFSEFCNWPLVHKYRREFHMDIFGVQNAGLIDRHSVGILYLIWVNITIKLSHMSPVPSRFLIKLPFERINYFILFLQIVNMSLTDDLDYIWTDDLELKGLTSHYKSIPWVFFLPICVLLLCACLNTVI